MVLAKTAQTKINSTKFGSITIDGITYAQDVIVTWEGKVKETETQTRHTIAKKEFFDLIFERPDTVIIGTGQSGDMQVSAEVKVFAKKKKVRLVAKPTPQAIKTFNQFVTNGKRVVAYMHVTC